MSVLKWVGQTRGLPGYCALIVGLLVGDVRAAEAPNVSLKHSLVAGGVSMIEGVDGFAGGNVGVSIGEDGIFLIDDELEAMGEKLRAFVAGLSSKPVRFVINTHWHGDHAGGNAVLGATGAVIFAHDRVRERLSADQLSKKVKQVQASRFALPIVTFSEDVTLHLNGDDIHAFHVAPAHTDGDVVVRFIKANVVHTGDLYIAQGYPFVDTGSGGKFDGFIRAADQILSLCDDKTRIIPGHGPVMGKLDYQAWRDMLVTLRSRVVALRSQGKTLPEVIAAKVGAPYNEAFGQGFIKSDQIVEAVYKTAEDGFVPAPGSPRSTAEPSKASVATPVKAPAAP